MTDTDLESRLDGLFSDVEPEAEAAGTAAPGRARAEARLEKAIADLLTGVPEAETREPAVAAALLGVEAIPAVPVKLEKGEEAPKPPLPPIPLTSGVPAAARPGEVAEYTRRVSTRSHMLHNVTTIGGVLLFLLLTGLVLRDPLAWSGLRTLYLAGYGAGILITLIQWLFSFSLSRTVREAEKRTAEAARLETLLTQRADELATTNAVLQKSALQLHTAIQISQATGGVLDADELAQQAVNLIRERFDLYYVGLFLIDESGQRAALRAGTGEAGQRMLALGTSIEVGSASAIGWSMASAQARVAAERDITSRRSLDEASPLLAQTRSQVAVPLRSRGRVLGALDVHSRDLEAFSESDIGVLQVVADQVAVALDNAETLARIEGKLDELEASQKRAVRERWLDALTAQAGSSYERTRPGTPLLDDRLASGGSTVLSQAIEQAQARGEVVTQPDAGNGTGQAPSTFEAQVRDLRSASGEAVLVAPISLRGEIMGALGLHEPGGEHWWTGDEIALVEAVADQMALAIENARLLAETRQRAERERLIADISAQVRASTDVNTILRTAIRELGRALRASDGLIRLEVSGEEESSEGAQGVLEGVEKYDGAGA